MRIQSVLIFVFCLVFLSCKKEEVDEAKVSEVETLKIDSERSKIDIKKELKNIKDNFIRINNVKQWTVIDSVDLYESTEGGEAKFYFSNKKLQKIVAVYYGETGQAIEEYYLLDSKLSFVFRKEFKYNRPIYWNEPDDEKFDFDKSIITETRSYFYRDVLFEQIKTTENNNEILIDDLEKEQESIKTYYNKLKLMSLTRQI